MPQFLTLLLILLPISVIPIPIVVYTGPNCHMCEVILNNVRYEYNNNFTDVTIFQFRESLYQQCDENLNGYTDDECHRKADQDSEEILIQLQHGTSSYRICQNEDFC